MSTFFQKITLIACLSMSYASGLLAQSNSLRVQNPQITWQQNTARIEAASFDVRLRGLYAEVSLNMTYSAQGSGYSNATDTLEVQHYFTLPADALIVDSWLWVENQIVYAKLIDRWTASAIYEDIVKRRRDPSILFKNQATGYEYRIYPMAGNKTRRVQLHFLMPIEWQNGQISFELPTNLLRFGNRTPTATVRLFDNSQWKNPRLSDFPNQTLSVGSDTASNAPIRTTTLTTAQIASTVRIAYDSPMKNGVFISTFKSAGENYYQMAVQPDQVLNLNITPQKLIFLVDFSSSNTPNFTTTDLLAAFKSNIRSVISNRDSFNIMFSKLQPTPLSNQWISGANLEATLAQINETTLSSFNSLPNLLAKGIEFIKNSNGGAVALMSNDASLASLNSSNGLLANLKNTFTTLPIIHVLDFSYYNNPFVVGNTYYYGNDYFYNILTAQTGGNFTNPPNYSSDMRPYFAQYFGNLKPYFDNFETFTTVADGFCFARFNIGGGTPFLSKPFLQVGKYSGLPPFQVEVSGSYQGTPFGRRVTIADSLTMRGDSTTRQIWAAAQILNLEALLTKDNATVRRIIDLSQKNLVLSLYTAFLALEPGMGGDTCRACRDAKSVVTVATKDPTTDSFRLVAAPNPFRNTTTLTIKFPTFDLNQKAQLEVLNLMGKVVRHFDLDIKAGDTSAEIQWDASDLPSGIYLVRFTAGSVVKVLKVAKTQ